MLNKVPLIILNVKETESESDSNYNTKISFMHGAELEPSHAPSKEGYGNIFTGHEWIYYRKITRLIYLCNHLHPGLTQVLPA